MWLLLGSWLQRQTQVLLCSQQLASSLSINSCERCAYCQIFRRRPLYRHGKSSQRGIVLVDDPYLQRNNAGISKIIFSAQQKNTDYLMEKP